MAEGKEALMKELREKTMEVEHLSMKMDEIESKNQYLINHIKSMTDINQEVLEKAKHLDMAEIGEEIAHKNDELKKFKRVNRQCYDLYLRFSEKYKELLDKFREQE